MEINDRVAVITGGAGGIGSAVARRFVADGARAIVVVDRDQAACDSLAEELRTAGVQSFGRGMDVTDEAAIKQLVDDVEDQFGPIDIFMSNAGAGAEGGIDASNEAYQSQWELHVLAHLYAARACIPSMTARGEGYLVQTASAAGLLAAMGSAPYTVTKAACISLGEYLSITHGDDGIRVSVLCPQGVNTAMAPRQLGDGGTDGIIEADEVAQVVADSIRDERFLILPHPEVQTYVERKATDRNRWLGGMRKLRRRSLELNESGAGLGG
ncbi:MAG: SDR family oxidoreductase [Actinomycetia bacterium]|nr:SDR family oxidoreductase [Actinomycetes bacterium]MCP3913751.1 SDR family oxidoreductase [Actinomycetes bacterium]MCP4086220.1 SDR family oxidoreductase [Actinomycetes bacterium]